jgi:hypothetical protein
MSLTLILLAVLGVVILIYFTIGQSKDSLKKSLSMKDRDIRGDVGDLMLYVGQAIKQFFIIVLWLLWFMFGLLKQTFNWLMAPKKDDVEAKDKLKKNKVAVK